MKDLAYKVVFDKIMEYLNKGVAPWRQTWKGQFPYNGKTHKMYRGINVWILRSAAYSDPRWYTFNQVVALGGKVKKGEKSLPVVFWKFLEVQDAQGNDKRVPLLRYYNVFNAEQTEDLNLPSLKKDVVTNANAEDVVAGYKDCPTIKHGGDIAAYSPSRDMILMPNQDTFEEMDNYYATLFHEMTHSTGHKDRLDRAGIAQADRSDKIKYSEEELVAEMGSAFLTNYAGIENTLEISAAYIKGWKTYLEDNPKVLVHAASKAQKAADYILGENYGFAQNEEDEEDEDTAVSNNPKATIA